jgi:hypothetical protein
LITTGFFAIQKGSAMKFKSPTDQPIHVALTNGHTCVIPPANEANPDGVDIDPMFHREAIAKGAEPAGLPPAPKVDSNTPTRSGVITAALQAMLDGSEESDFKKDGTPDLNSVSRRCGFKVSREEVEAIWAGLKESVT